MGDGNMMQRQWILVAASVGMLVGCGGAGGGGVDGAYCTRGDMKVVLKGGVVSSEGRDGSYTVDGETVLITNPFGQTNTFRRMPDGSLSSGAVTMTKCAG